MSIYKILPYVYRLDNLETGEFYIGYRKANKLPSFLDLPKYKTSSRYVTPIFNKFKWQIVAEFFDGASAYEFEQQLIFENWGNPLLLNKSCHYGKGVFISPKGKNPLKGRTKTEAQKRLISSIHKGKVVPQEVRDKISNSMKGKLPNSAGKPKSQSAKDKLSATMKGRAQPTGVCPHCSKKMSISNLHRYHFDKCKLHPDTSKVI